MFIREATMDSIIDLRAAPSDLSIPAHTEFIMRKKDSSRKGRVYSMQRSTEPSPPQNSMIGSETNHSTAALATESTKAIIMDPERMFSADLLSPAPMYLAIAADTPTPSPVPTDPIIPYIGWDMDMADMASDPKPEHQIPSMNVCRFSTIKANRRGRDIVNRAFLGFPRRLLTSLLSRMVVIIRYSRSITLNNN